MRGEKDHIGTIFPQFLTDVQSTLVAFGKTRPEDEGPNDHDGSVRDVSGNAALKRLKAVLSTNNLVALRIIDKDRDELMESFSAEEFAEIKAHIEALDFDKALRLIEDAAK